MKYPVYDIEFNPETDLGMTAISFVDYPAICQDFVYFSRHNSKGINPGQIILANAEKREIVSPILIPNQLVLRVTDNGEKYYVRWTKDVIEKVAQFYIINQFNNNFTVMHEWFEKGNEKDYDQTLISDVYMKKMWIIDDPRNDDANKVYGYHLPEGTLMVHLKIYNRKLWQRIKSGELRGLSIEAFLPQSFSEEINFKKTDIKDMKNPKELFEQFMLWYNQVSEEAKELSDIAGTDETESGELSLKYFTSDTDYIEIKADGTAIASDGTEVVDGEYALSDGNVLVIENGKFKETKSVEDVETEKPLEAPIAEAEEDDKEETEKEDEKPDEEKEEEQAEEETPEDVKAPATLVEVEIGGEVFNVPQQVADYIKSLEDAAMAGENFRKELAKIQSVTPSVKPVGAAVKETEVKTDATAFTASDLIDRMNKKLK